MSRSAVFVFVAVLAVACEQTAPNQPPPESGSATPGAAPGAAATAPGGADKAPAGSPSASSSAAATGSAPVEPPKPQFKEITVPSGTALNLTLVTGVASDTSKVEDAVRARVSKPIVVEGMTAIPEGAEVLGSVTSAERSGRVKGRASIAFRFTELSAWDDRHEITTARVSRQAAATKGDDAKKIGIGAGAGALVGAIAGGGKGAAVGAAVGGGAGTGVVMATRGDEVRLGAGAAVSTTLQSPLTIRVPLK
jgi:hypothetical protein